MIMTRRVVDSVCGAQAEKDTGLLFNAQIAVNHHVEVANNEKKTRTEEPVKGRLLEIDELKKILKTGASSHSNLLIICCFPIRDYILLFAVFLSAVANFSLSLPWSNIM